MLLLCVGVCGLCVNCAHMDGAVSQDVGHAASIVLPSLRRGCITRRIVLPSLWRGLVARAIVLASRRRRRATHPNVLPSLRRGHVRIQQMYTHLCM